jgi:hypothetical protein
LLSEVQPKNVIVTPPPKGKNGNYCKQNKKQINHIKKYDTGCHIAHVFALAAMCIGIYYIDLALALALQASKLVLSN